MWSLTALGQPRHHPPSTAILSHVSMGLDTCDTTIGTPGDSRLPAWPASSGAARGVDVCESDSLAQFYQVNEAYLCATLTSHGWRLYLRHRHYSGNWGDCVPVLYERLTIGELQDVLDATVAGWPQGTPGQSA